MNAALESDATPILINKHSGHEARANGVMNGKQLNHQPPPHLSNQSVEKIYDSVFTYRKHAADVESAAGCSDSWSLAASANQLPHANGAVGSGNERMSVTVSASYHHPPRQEERHPMRGPLPPSPEDFLRNIQRVMEKKWKVAQTLSVDVNNPYSFCSNGGPSGTPVMGFRETAIITTIPEAADPHPPATDPGIMLPPPPPEVHCPQRMDPARSGYNCLNNNNNNNQTIVPAPFKRTKSLVPPKPPKRSESTRLSGIRPHADIRA